jgi:hypothetical protein
VSRAGSYFLLCPFAAIEFGAAAMPMIHRREAESDRAFSTTDEHRWTRMKIGRCPLVFICG